MDEIQALLARLLLYCAISVEIVKMKKKNIELSWSIWNTSVLQILSARPQHYQICKQIFYLMPTYRFANLTLTSGRENILKNTQSISHIYRQIRQIKNQETRQVKHDPFKIFTISCRCPYHLTYAQQRLQSYFAPKIMQNWNFRCVSAPNKCV